MVVVDCIIPAAHTNHRVSIAKFQSERIRYRIPNKQSTTADIMVCIEDCSLEGKMLARLRAALVGLAPLASVIAFASIDPAVRPQSPISTLKRLEYTKGYIGLGLIKEASAELDAIDGDDRMSVEVLRVRIDLYMEAKRWNMVVKMAGHLTVTVPADEQIWISWAYALRELQFIKDAEGVLLRAEKDFGHKSAILHYNLACYSCLLGYFDEANKRLKRAVRLDKRFEDAWADDADLKGLLDIF